MLCIFSLWIWRSGTFKGTDILCAAIAIILLANPLSILDTGLQLSVLCVSVIMLMAQTINKIRLPNWISPPKIRTITTNLLKILAVSFAIQLFLLPVLLSRFGIAGAWFPVNALWLPVLGLVVLPFAMLGLFFCSLPWTWSFFLAKFCLNIASIPCAALVNLLSELSTSGLLDEPVFMKPHWSLFPAFALLIVLFILAWQSAKNLTTMPAKKNIATGCLVLLAIAPCLRLMDALDYRLGLYTLDVGQGQAIALKYAPGSILLLDGGGMNPSSFDIGRNVVAPCLTDNAMPHKISLLNTHPDYDHLGGLFWIAEKFQPLYFFHNGHAARESINGQWKTLRAKGNAPTLYAGDVIILGDPERDLRLEVLHPPAGGHAGAPEPDAAWHGNAASLILRLARGNEGLALFTGDASKNAQTFILDDNGKYQAEVVFAPHHGSDHNLLPALYEASNPKLVIVNCGSQNHWKFPGRKLIAYLKRKKINELDTGHNGRIDIAFAEDNTFSVDTIKNQPHNFIRAAKRDRNAKDKFGGDYFSTE